MMFNNGFVAGVCGGTLCDKQNKQTMKTLINKTNPQIRITAPEITTAHPPVSNEGYVYWIPAINQMYNPIDWTLVEEEPEKEEICPKCVHSGKDDGYCYYPYGGMKRQINENGVCECTGFCEKEQKQTKRKQSPALKKIVDNLTEEKLAKTKAEMKPVEEEPEGWNKADCVKEIPFSLIYEEFAEHWRLGNAVEPGDYYIPISRLRWGIRRNLEEIPSNVDLEKEIDKTVSECTNGYNFDWYKFAYHFYELGRKGGSK